MANKKSDNSESSEQQQLERRVDDMMATKPGGVPAVSRDAAEEVSARKPAEKAAEKPTESKVEPATAPPLPAGAAPGQIYKPEIPENPPLVVSLSENTNNPAGQPLPAASSFPTEPDLDSKATDQAVKDIAATESDQL